MELYKNNNGDSGVHAFECGSDYIRVRLSTGAEYLYTYRSAGVENIEHMKVLAKNGAGLNAFINRVVRKLYEK